MVQHNISYSCSDLIGNKYWFYNKKLHRADGPAVEYLNGKREYWLDGKRYTEKYYNKIWNENREYFEKKWNMSWYPIPDEEINGYEKFIT